jgi:phage repressor protein C with HTH and peptisase S24 domain
MSKAQAPEHGDLVLLPLVAARLAAGSGSLETGGEPVGHFAFHSDWIRRKGTPENMVLMRVTGDSMEPEIRHGDMVLIDRGKTQIYGHALYAVGVNDEIYIKEIETLPGNRLVLRSLNSRYHPIEVDLRGDLADSVRIIGRVLWWCREV